MKQWIVHPQRFVISLIQEDTISFLDGENWEVRRYLPFFMPLYLYTMATARPFAYNPGPQIPGTDQVGSLSIGAPTSGFTNNPQYWNGPDEELGYVIAQSVSGNTQPTPLFGVTASVGFFRSSDLTEGSFIALSEVISGENFTTGAEAKTWLNNNGYWTSYGLTPSIVTSNLQLYLTAGDTDSYPGSGTSWFDLSPNSYTSTLINGVGFSSASGGTLTFNGVNQYVDTNNFINAESFSVSSWFRTSAGGIKMIISKETNGGWPWNYRIWLNGGTIVGDIAQAGGVSTSISSPLSTYNNGGWYNVVFTRNDSTLKLYVNGVQIATAADTLTGTISNNQEVWIGQSAYLGGSYDYTGDISEIMVYNAVLTDAEVLQNFDATKTRFGF